MTAREAEKTRVLESIKEELSAIRIAREEAPNRARAESGTIVGRSGAVYVFKHDSHNVFCPTFNLQGEL